MEGISGTTVIVLTGDQLREFANEVVSAALSARKEEEARPRQEKRYVYGLRGIRDLFNVSHSTAQAYKNTFLAPAISQRGKKIMVDADYARELYRNEMAGRNS